MKTANMLKIAASSLVISAGAMTVGPALTATSPVVASKTSLNKLAQTSAAKAEAALAGRKVKDAVDWAERAVAADPENADFRFLLGQSYLTAGRFASAETSFQDVLRLNPSFDRAGLKLALSQIAQGKSAEAVGVLEEHRSSLSAADYGLALALAGDPQAAIDVLEPAARSEDATSTTRQNLALSYALVGRWAEARVVAGQDMPAHLVHDRIAQWAAFARPTSASDQVASLLGVTPRADSGQPAALALRSDAGAVAVAQAPAEVAPVAEVAAPEAAPVVVAQATPVAEVQPAQFEVTEKAAPAAPVTDPVYQTVAKAVEAAEPDAPLIRSDSRPVKQLVVSAAPVTRKKAAASSVRAVEGGRFVVQLGAFSSTGRADAAWKAANRKLGALSSYDARQSRVKVRNGSLYRLAVSGFVSRADAGRVCTQVRATGGTCFVRSLTNNEPIRFAARGRAPAGGTVLAARR
jgi:Flp pilus assembly protein TadD